MEEVSLSPTEWSDGVERVLSRASGTYEGFRMQDVRQSIEYCHADLVKVLRGTEVLGYLVLFGDGDEMVIQLGAAIDGKTNVLSLAMKAAKQWAKTYGLSSIRVHVEGQGRERIFKQCGFEYAETVLRMAV